MDVRRAQAVADIEGVAEQVEAGELDEAAAKTLVARYQAELDALENEAEPVEEQAGWSRRRVVGTLLLVGALVAVSALAYAAIRPRDGGFVTGDVGGVDLDSVTNDQMEAVIAASEGVADVAAMRVALADRYFDELNYPSALPHYLEALDGQLDSGRRARALARIGWMTFVSGVADVAESYLGLALETDPEYDEARFFLGLIMLDGCRPDEALRLLEPLLTLESVPDDVRADIERSIGGAQALQEAGTCP